jgi:hypothetical protein
VLFAGLALTQIRTSSTRRAALAAEGFAFMGTLVGAFTILIGVGPRTLPDVLHHVAILIPLAAGLRVAIRARDAL